MEKIILFVYRGMLVLIQYLQTISLMLGKEILDVSSQGVGDVFINSFLIFTWRRYLLFCEATSVLEDLEKSYNLLEDTSQWYNNHLEKLNFQKTQFCMFSNMNLKDFNHLNFFKTQKLNHSYQSMSWGLFFTQTSHFISMLLILQLEQTN